MTTIAGGGRKKEKMMRAEQPERPGKENVGGMESAAPDQIFSY